MIELQNNLYTVSDSDIVFDFAVGLATCARVFTMDQVARHPKVSWRTRPKQRAGDMLRVHQESFDVLPGRYRGPFIWRLSSKEKRRRGLSFKSISPHSQKLEHWLSIGDVWMELVFNGLRPEKWYTEKLSMGGFDVFFMVRGMPFLMEVQRSVLKKKEWELRWKHRRAWYQERKWETDEKWQEIYTCQNPKVILVDLAKHPKEVLCLPKNTIYSQNVKDVPTQIRAYVSETKRS